MLIKGGRTRHLRKAIFMALVFLFSLFSFSEASVPSFINYQSRLRDSDSVPITSATTIQFSIYNDSTNGSPSDTPSSTGPLLWTETYDGGSCAEIDPDDEGYFTVKLGSCTSFPSYLDFTSDTLYLGVKVGTDSEATPRAQLGSAPFAQTADHVFGTGQSAIGTTEAETDTSLTIAPTSASGIGATIRGFASQVADLFRIITDVGERLLTFTAEGRLGIGTETPERKLDVADDTNPQMRLTQTEDTTYADLQVDSNGDLLINVDGETNQLVLDSGGNVGVGTSTPGEALEVVGNIELSGNLIPNTGTQSVGLVTNRFNYGYFDNLDVTNLSYGSADISGTISNTFTINSDNATADTEDASLVFSRGTETPDAALAWDSTNDEFDFNFPLNVTNVGSSYSFLVNDEASDTTPFVIDADGNVGIGTSSPDNSLQVNSGRIVVGSTDIGNVLGGVAVYGTNANYAYGYQAGQSTTNNITFGWVSKNDANDAYAFLETYGGNNALLIARGIAGNVGIGISNGSYPQSKFSVLGGTAIGTYATTAAAPSNGLIVSGNVGIGDASPASLFTVGSGDLFQINSTGAISAATSITSSGTITFSGLTTDGIVTTASGVLGSTATLGANYITADALDFTEFKDAMTLDASTDIAVTGTNEFSITNSGTGNSFIVYDSSGDTTPFVIDDDGNVGIGTSSPTFKLEIAGTSATSDRMLGINGTQVLYLPDQSGGAFLGSLFVGNGGGSLSHSVASEGQDNTGVGIGALLGVTTGRGNTAEGYQALYTNTTGNYNTAVGGLTMFDNISGSYNSALGLNALYNNETGNNNSSLGYRSLFYNTTGSDNTALGTFAGRYAGTSFDQNNASTYSVYLGEESRAGASGNTNEIVIGYNAVGNGSNTVTLGNDNISGIYLKGLITANNSITGLTGITSSGTITFSGLTTDGFVTVTSGVLGSTATLDANYITADSLDFSEFKDAMTLDASTDISITGTNVFSITNTGTGNSFVVNDGSGDATPFVIDADGNVGIGTASPSARLTVNGTTDVSRLQVSGVADRLVDADGSTTTDVGIGDAISQGDPLVAVDTADNLCTDSLTTPTIVFILTGETTPCDTTDGSITDLLGTAVTSTVYTVVDSEWAYVDTNSDTDYTDGEDLYIDTAGNLIFDYSGVYIASSTEGVLENTLYQHDGNLYWNGTPVVTTYSTSDDDIWVIPVPMVFSTGFNASGDGTFDGKTEFNDDVVLNTKTPGSVLFVGADNSISENNYNFFWDNTLDRLGIQTRTPGAALDVNGTSHFSGDANFDQRLYSNKEFRASTLSVFTDKTYIEETIISSTDPEVENVLDVSGSALFQGTLKVDGTYDTGDGGLVVDGTTTLFSTNDNIDILSVDGGILQGLGQPEVVGSVTDGTNLNGAAAVKVFGDYAYVAAQSDSSLRIYDVSESTSPEYVGGVKDTTNLNSPNDVFIAGRYAFVTSGVNSSVTVINVSNPTSPTIATVIQDSSLAGAAGIYVAGNYAYVVSPTQNDIVAVDISASVLVDGVTSTISNLTDNTNLNGVRNIYVDGKYAYVVSPVNNSLRIIDVSDPGSMTIVGSLSGVSFGGASGVYVSGSYAYVANSTADSLRIVDISDPTNPTTVGSVSDFLELSGAREVMVSGDYAYVAVPDLDQITVVDISDPTAPEISKKITDATNLDTVYDVYVAGRNVFAVSPTNDRLTVVDTGGTTLQSTEVGVLEAGSFTVTDNAYIANSLSANALFINSNTFLGGELSLGGSTNGNVTGDIVPTYDALYNLGSSTFGWKNLYVGAGTPTVAGGVKDDANLAFASGLSIQDNYAYVTAGNDSRLNVIDITNKSQPVVVGSVKDATKLALPNGVYAQGHYVYVVSEGTDSLNVIDVSDPTSPTIIGRVTSTLLDNAFNVHVVSERAYVVSTNSNSLVVVNVANPKNPVIEGSVVSTELAGAEGVYVVGNYAYVASTNDDSLRIIDVSDPAKPTIVGGVKDTSNLAGIASVFASGRYVYVANPTDDSMRIIDVSDPTNPAIVGGVQDATSLNDASSVFVAGNYAYVTATSNDSLAIIDVSNPSNPAIVAEIQDAASLNGALHVQVVGKYAYVTNSVDNSLMILELSGISTPTAYVGGLAAGTFSVSNDADISGDVSADTLHISSGIFSSGKLSVYGADITIYEGGLHPYSGFDDALCELTKGSNCELDGANDIVTKGDYAYIAGKNDNGIQVVDMHDPENPVYSSAIDAVLDSEPLTGVSALEIHNDLLLAVSNVDEAFMIYNIAKVNEPQLMWSMTDTECEAIAGTGACKLDDATNLAAYGSYVFVASKTGSGIEVMDISNPFNAKHVASITVAGQPNSITIHGDKLYIASGVPGSLTIIDISDPTNMREMGAIIDDAMINLGGANDVVVVGTLAYVAAADDDAFVIIDVSDPANPTIKGDITDSDCDVQVGGDGCALDGALSLEIKGNTAYVAGYADNGIEKIDVSDSTNPTHMGTTFDNGETYLGGPTQVHILGKTVMVTSGDEDGVQVFIMDGFEGPAADIGSLLAGNINVRENVEVEGKVTANSLVVGAGGAVVDNALTVNSGLVLVTNGDPEHQDALDDTTCDTQVGGTGCELEGVSDIVTDGRYAYAVSDIDDGMQVIDISNPNDLKPVAAIDADTSGAPIHGASSIIKDGNDIVITSPEDNAISIVDVAEPANPVVIASLTKADCLAQGCLLDGVYDVSKNHNHLFVTSRLDNSISSFDITDRAHPKFVSSLTHSALAGARNLAVSPYSNKAYVTTTDSVVAVDISDPANMTLAGIAADLPANVGPADFDFAGHYLYLATYLNNSVYVLDTSDDNLNVVGEINDTSCDDKYQQNCKLDGVDDIVVVGGMGFAAGGDDDGIEAISTNDPTSPQHIGSIENDGEVMLDGPASIAETGGTLLVASHDSSAIEALQIPGVKAPSGTFDSLWAGSLTLAGDAIVDGKLMVDGLTVSGSVTAAESLVLREGQLIVTAGDPQHEGSIDDTTCDATVGGDGCELNGAEDVAVIGKYAFVVSDVDNGFSVLDITDPKNPVHVASVDAVADGAPLNGASGLVVEGDYLYIVSDVDDALVIYDISDPTNPVLAGDVTDGDCNDDGCALDGAHGIAILGDVAYVVSENDDGITSFDISDKANPKFISALTASQLTGAYRINISDDKAFIASRGSDALVIVNIGDPKNMFVEGYIGDAQNTAYHLGELRDVDISDHYAFVVSYLEDSVSVVDFSDPNNLVLVDELIDEVCDLDEMALAPDEDSGGIFTKIARAIVGKAYAADPDNPCMLDGADSIVIAGDYAYVGAAIDDGIDVIDISDPTNIHHVGSIENGDNVLLDGVTSLDIEGDRLFATSDVSNALEIMRLDGAEMPTAKIGNLQVGELEVLGDARVDGRLIANSLHIGSSGIASDGDVSVNGILWLSNIVDVEDNGGLVFENSIDQVIDDEPVVVGSYSNATYIGGALRSYVVGNYTYAIGTTSDSLTVIDTTDPTSPVRIGSLIDSTNLNNPTDVFIAGRYAYVTLGEEDSLAVVDVSNPKLPTLVGTVTDSTTMDSPNKVYVSGHYAYVTSFISDSLTIIDITNPANPKVVGSLLDDTSLDGARSVATVGQYAYIVTSDQNSLAIIDVSDPTDPTLEGSVVDATKLDGASDVYVAGRYVYVTAYDTDNLTIVDISDPDAPAIVGNVSDSTNLNGAYSVDVAGDYAFVTGFDGNTLAVVDVSDPTTPTVTTTLTDATNLAAASDIFVSGKYAYVSAYGANALVVIDIHGTDLVSARIGTIESNNLHVSGDTQISGGLNVAGGINTTGGITALAPSSFYSATSSAALKVTGGIEQVVGSDPVLAGSLVDNLNLNQARDVFVAYPYAYAVSDFQNSLSIIDITQPDSPSLVDVTIDPTYLDGATAVTVVGRYAYVAAKDAGSLTVLDVSKPTDPIEISHYDSPEIDGTSSVYVKGHYAYVTGSLLDSLAVIDISDPTNLVNVGTLIDSTNLDGASDVVVSGDYAYVTGETSNSLAVVDISDPTDPSLVESLIDSTNLDAANSIYVSGSYAYVTGGLSDSLAVIDISDPSAPALADSLLDSTNMNNAYDVYVAGRYAYVTAFAATRVVVIDVSDPNSISLVGYLSDATYLNGPTGIQVVGPYAYVSSYTSDSISVLDIHGTKLTSAYIDNLSTSGLQVYDDAFVGGGLSVAGGINSTDGINIFGSSGFYNPVSSDDTAFTITQDGTGNILDIFEGTATALTIVNGGDVGIGLDDPKQKLHVLASGSSGWSGVDRGILITDAYGPRVVFEDSGESGDDKIMLIKYEDEYMKFSAVNDLGSSYTNENILVLNRDGKVGVGTGTPLQRLHVSTGGSSGLTSADRGISLTDATGPMIVFEDSGEATANKVMNIRYQDEAMVFGAMNDAGTIYYQDNILVLDRNSRVGIGVFDPADQLEILSTNDAQLRLSYDDSDYHALQVVSDGGLTWSALGTDADLNFDFSGATDGDFSVNTDDLFVDTSSGSVGIGTTGPAYVLDIKATSSVGSAAFTGTGLDDMTTGGTFIGSSALNYRVEIDATGTPDTFRWSDDGGSTWDASGVAITGSAQTLYNGVTVTFGATTGHTLADYWDFSTTVTNPFAVQNAAGTRSLYVGNDGKVGIGVTDPDTVLQVQGMLNYTNMIIGDKDDTNPALKLWGNTALDYAFIQAGGTTANANLRITKYQTSSGNLDDFQIYSDQTYFSGNVGVGISTPATKLDIEDDSNTQALRIYRSTSADLQETGLVFDVSAGGNSSLAYAKGGIFFERDDSTGGYGKGSMIFALDTVSDDGTVTKADEKMRIDVTGNVGIGTTDPTATLHINSNATTNNALAVNANSLTNGYGLQLYSNSSDTSVRRLASIINDNSASSGTVALYVQQDSLGDIVNVNDGSTEVFTIADGGFVGMGLGGSTPSYPLDIVGYDSGGAGLDRNNIRISDTATNLTTKQGGIVGRNYNNSEENVLLMAYSASDTENIVRFGGGDAQHNAATQHIFYATSNATGLYGGEKMRINSYGVGMGMGASGATDVGPFVPLEVEDTNPVLRLTDDRSDFGGAAGIDLGTIDFYSRDTSTVNDYDPVAQILVEAANGTVFPDGELVFSVGINGVLAESLRIHDSSAIQFTQYGAGTLTTDASGNITASSDERLKNIEGSFNKGLAAIRGLEPINYQWNEESGMETENTYTGFSAQNVQEFIPEAVGEDSRGYLSFSDRPVLAATVNAVKELDEQMQAQVLMVDNLNGQLEIDNEGDGEGASQVLAEINSEFELLKERVTTLEEAQAELETIDQTETEEVEIPDYGLEELQDLADLAFFEAVNYKVWKATEGMVFAARVRFEDVVEFASDVIFRGSITVNTDTAGTITIPAGEIRVKATFNIPFDESPTVNLTPAQRIESDYFLEDVNEEGFTVSIAETQAGDISFNWTALIIEGEPINVEIIQQEEENLGEEDLEEEPTDLEEDISINTLTVVSPDLGFVRLRAESNIDSEELAQIPDGAQLEYVSEEYGWYQVKFEGQTGWISGDYVAY